MCQTPPHPYYVTVTFLMSNLNIYYQNVRGLRTKLVNLRSSLPLMLSYDILILTETWLISDISDSELGLFGFIIFRLDRSIENSTHSRGGGVLIAINPKFNPLSVALNVNNVEQLFVTITLNLYNNRIHLSSTSLSTPYS